MRRTRALAAMLGLVATLVAPAAASAYSYNYGFGNAQDEVWYSRWAAHNYSYVSGYTASVQNLHCVKLTRTTDGSNYGDAYCVWGDPSGHHYAGDTGTFTHGRYNSPYNTQGYTINKYEEW